MRAAPCLPRFLRPALRAIFTLYVIRSPCSRYGMIAKISHPFRRCFPSAAYCAASKVRETFAQNAATSPSGFDPGAKQASVSMKSSTW